jgi:hypothetical protein
MIVARAGSWAVPMPPIAASFPPCISGRDTRTPLNTLILPFKASKNLAILSSDVTLHRCLALLFQACPMAYQHGDCLPAAASYI